jgi:CNT family concentrative nucleoside transporter
MLRLQSVLGLVVFTAIAWALSENRRRVPWRTVGIGIGLQVVVAGALLYLPVCRQAFSGLNSLVAALDRATTAGTSFVFGYLGGGSKPFVETDPGASFILAFRGLPMVLVISSLSALLFYWRVLPLIVRGFSWALSRTLGVGGAEGVAVAANIFLGMVESPLLVRPYVARLTRSELFCVMTAGMATVAGTVMALYAMFLERVLPDAAGHILTASLISAPAAVVIAKAMVPETGPVTAGEVTDPDPASGPMDAITKGALQGIQLLIGIVAMLVVLVGLVHLVNQGLALLPDLSGAPLTLERMLGWAMAPVAWVMGVPWSEAIEGGRLLGVKTVLNEFIAYVQLGKLHAGTLSPRSIVIMTYALCGFANPGSLGIMIGGLGAMAPERRAEVVDLGLRSILSGTLAACMTGAVVGLLTA